MSDVHARQLLRLTALLQLEKRARSATRDELGFVMVNETLGVVQYRQALLWSPAPSQRILAVSGVTVHDPATPALAWMECLFRWLDGRGFTAIEQIVIADVPDDLRREWSEWLPPYVVWVPLPQLGALVLAREEPLGEGDRNVLALLADAYAHAWRAHLPRRRTLLAASMAPRTRVFVAASAIAAVIGAGFIPIRQSVLAPAEVTPHAPAILRAPLEGVVESVHVRPNETVREGQVLFALDARGLRNQLDVALGAQEAATAELRQAEQFAVVDQKVRASLPLLQGKLDQQIAEVVYLRQQLERVEVKAPKAGLAVFDDPNDWLGRPVAIGERVMLLANPEEVEIDARLPVADAIGLEPGTPVRLFLNIEPERPREAVLTFVSYQAHQGVDGILGYRVKARFIDGDDLPRIGLKGTAKLYGRLVPLAYAIFRRPVAAARQWLGL